jgi:hypothetical protein
MEKSATFGPFSGHKRAEADTTKRRGDTKDRCSGRGGETKNGRDRHRHEDANGDRDLIDGWESALLCDAIERTRVKRNRSARPTRIGGFAKGARREIKKATTPVVAQDTLSASSSRTSSPSSLLALGNHLLLATHCTVI